MITKIILVLAASMGIVGCSQREAPPSPVVMPDGENRQWTNVEPMIYKIGATNDTIVVPKGFVTDFASIPQELWSFGLSPHDKYSRAAVIHDYLYWTQACTREQSDRILVIAMKESNVGAFDENAIYAAVHTFGQTAWDNNRRERDQGLPRVIPENRLRPPDPNMNWNAYRAILKSEGVRDPAFDSNPAYCRYGDTTEVPTGK